MGGVPAKDRDSVSSYNVKKLWDKHKRVLRRIALGHKNKDIAEELNMAPATVSYIRNSDLGREKLEELHEEMDERTMDIEERMQEIAPKALDVLEDIIKGNSEAFDEDRVPLKQRRMVASDILEKAGHVAPSKVDKQVEHRITSDELQEIKQRAEEADNVVATYDEDGNKEE